VFVREPLRRQGSRRVVLADERQDAGVAAVELVVRAEAEDRCRFLISIIRLVQCSSDWG